MADGRDDVITALREAAAASAGAREVMQEIERALLEGVHVLREGTDIMEALATSHISEHRARLEEALRAVVHTRHRFRVVLVAECVSAGMSGRQIAELWGFSRQRAATLVQEARAEQAARRAD